LRVYPEISVLDEGVVVDRNRITGGGITAGLDFALTPSAEVVGPPVAQARQLTAEYRPAPPVDSGSSCMILARFSRSPSPIHDSVCVTLRSIVKLFFLKNFIGSNDVAIEENRKTIFITGAASGMGLATARLFSERGWYVGGYDVDVGGLQALATELGAQNCIVGPLDVTDRANYTKALADFSAETNGRLDLLFNNAGIGRGGFFDEQSFEDVMAVVNVNFVGVLNGIHLATDLLKATPNSLCFTTSSSSATFGMAGIAVYSATKHAVKGLTEALSVEFSRFGVRVADTLPGLIDTAILPDALKQNAPTDGMFRLIPPVEVAKAVWASYHDEPERLHWFVPQEIGDLDKASALDPEGTRAKLASESTIMAMLEKLRPEQD
jgi:NAD(P)-dependent dehydrogenase (short-subunit alcohol dehydrogenase family)